MANDTMSRHSASDNVAERRNAVISTMISSLRRGEHREYFVGLFGYYIEGAFYSASGPTLDITATQEIRQTDVGFACIAMFRPNLLEPSIVEANGISEINVGGQMKDVVLVRLEVMLDDVWAVSEFIDGIQHDLFLDAEKVKSRLEEIFSSRRH